MLLLKPMALPTSDGKDNKHTLQDPCENHIQM